MSYLEEDDLVIGTKYECQLYDSTQRLVLIYVGDSWFEGDDFAYTLNGDVRYVFRKIDE